MKIACQHLLCRRDLSCTKVNAVTRLSNVCTLASDCQRRGCSSARMPGSPREGRAESCRQPAAPPGHDKQTQLFKLVRIWGPKPSQLKKGATKPPSGSAIFLQKKRNGGENKWTLLAGMVKMDRSMRSGMLECDIHCQPCITVMLYTWNLIGIYKAKLFLAYTDTTDQRLSSFDISGGLISLHS